VGGGGDLLAEVAAAGLGGAEAFGIGGVHQGIGHLLQQGSDQGPQRAQEALAALAGGFGDFGGRLRGRSGGG
jgi:hypothetical protein